MTPLPRISVITIVRNAEKTLEKAITSVITQSYPNLEYIIIDGHSIDKSVEIIKKYDSYLAYWHSQPDRGGNDAYNIGLRHASGDIVAFLNADDWYEGTILHQVAKLFLLKQRPDVITCQARILKETATNSYITLSDFIDQKTLELSLTNILFGMPLLNARFFKRSLLNTIGGFLPFDSKGNYLISADRDLLIRLCLASPTHSVLNQLGYTYLAHAGSQTMSEEKSTLVQVLNEHLNICQKYLTQASLSIQEKKQFASWRINQTLRLLSTQMKSSQWADVTKSLGTLFRSIYFAITLLMAYNNSP